MRLTSSGIVRLRLERVKGCVPKFLGQTLFTLILKGVFMPVSTMTDLDAVTQRLAATHVEPSGVSFQGKSLKLDSEEDAVEVVTAISSCSDLSFLNMEGNTLGVQAAQAIAKSLESHPELKRALWKDMFTGRMKTEIPKALSHLGHGLVRAQACLVELDLSDNAFGPIGVEGLAFLLRSAPCYTLQELRLNNNGLGISGGKMLASALLECHKNAQAEGRGLALKVFVAGRNRLENDGAKALANVFKILGTLEELSMPQNGIYHVGITALSEALCKNSNLRILNLNDNTLTSRGAAPLAKALPFVPGLRILNLGDCLLKTSGARLLAEALSQKHTELEEVYLSCNEIGLDGGLALVASLANKSKLKVLDLDGNQFRSAGCDRIRQVLSDNGQLDKLVSLDDDEGVDGEESEPESDTEDYEDGNTESDEDLDDEENLTEQKEKMSQKQTSVTVQEFLKDSTGENLIAVTEEKLLNNAKALPQDVFVDQLMPMLMKVSALSTDNQKEVQDAALSTSEALLRLSFNWAQQGEPARFSLVNNALLVHLGLIKGEDKSLKLTWNLDGCLIALEHSLIKEVLPSSTCHLLRFFLERPNSGGSTLPVTKDRILKLLQKVA